MLQPGSWKRQFAAQFACSLVLTAFIYLPRAATTTTKTTTKSADECADCRLTANSLDELLRKPRKVDAHSRLELDLEKMKKLVCKELLDDSERERCRAFYFQNLDSVDKWRKAAMLLSDGKLLSSHDFVCIHQLKLCCSSGSYGPKCSRCPKCAPNERCEGEGTRRGNGTCQCKPGHMGADCATCLPGYYRVETATRSSSCEPCHKSCEYCRAAGPKGCEVCRHGFAWQPSYGCLDVDECLQSNKQICGPNTFCVNTEGSYFCYECDRACDGCHGDGPDMCLRCANGYKLDAAGNCVATRKTILPPEANYYRYAIYLGLCICTCIILHNSVYLASLIGLTVALYIGASEFVMLGHPGEPSANPSGQFASPASHLGL